jgi:hypothetical protein
MLMLSGRDELTVDILDEFEQFGLSPQILLPLGLIIFSLDENTGAFVFQNTLIVAFGSLDLYDGH